MITKSEDTVWHCSSKSIVCIQNSITPPSYQRIKEYVTLSEDCEAPCALQKGGRGAILSTSLEMFSSSRHIDVSHIAWVKRKFRYVILPSIGFVNTVKKRGSDAVDTNTLLAPHRSYAQGAQCFRRDAVMCKSDLSELQCGESDNRVACNLESVYIRLSPAAHQTAVSARSRDHMLTAVHEFPESRFRGPPPSDARRDATSVHYRPKIAYSFVMDTTVYTGSEWVKNVPLYATRSLRICPLVEIFIHKAAWVMVKFHEAFSAIISAIVHLKIPNTPINTLASHQGELGSIPGRVTGLSKMGIVPDDTLGSAGFLGDFPFPPPLIPAPLHTHFNHPHWLSRPRRTILARTSEVKLTECERDKDRQSEERERERERERREKRQSSLSRQLARLVWFVAVYCVFLLAPCPSRSADVVSGINLVTAASNNLVPKLFQVRQQYQGGYIGGYSHRLNMRFRKEPPRFSYLGNMTDVASSRRIFSGNCRPTALAFLLCSTRTSLHLHYCSEPRRIPALLHTHFAFTLIGSRDLDVKSRPNLSTHAFTFLAISRDLTDLPWRSRLVRHSSGVREALGWSPGQGMGLGSSTSVGPLCPGKGNNWVGGGGGTVVERIAHARPPTKANRVQSLTGSPDFRKWESCRTMPLVGGPSRGSPVSPILLIPALSPGRENLVFAPFGLATNLAMLLEAADGATASELRQALGLPAAASLDEMRLGFKAYFDSFELSFISTTSLERSDLRNSSGAHGAVTYVTILPAHFAHQLRMHYACTSCTGAILARIAVGIVSQAAAGDDEAVGSFNMAVLRSSDALSEPYKAVLAEYYRANITDTPASENKTAGVVHGWWRDKFAQLCALVKAIHYKLSIFKINLRKETTTPTCICFNGRTEWHAPSKVGNDGGIVVPYLNVEYKVIVDRWSQWFPGRRRDTKVGSPPGEGRGLMATCELYMVDNANEYDTTSGYSSYLATSNCNYHGGWCFRQWTSVVRGWLISYQSERTSHLYCHQQGSEVNAEQRRDEGEGFKQEIPEKTRRPAASSGTIPTCENPVATPPGIEPGSLWLEASSRTTIPPRPLISAVIAEDVQCVLFLCSTPMMCGDGEPSMERPLRRTRYKVLELRSDSGVMSHWKDYHRLAAFAFLSHVASAPFRRSATQTAQVPMIPQVGLFRSGRLEHLGERLLRSSHKDPAPYYLYGHTYIFEVAP
ncbi:hypothetical protein PR048_015089 [Dryococelus australis]|uniref:Uncharacterized protein n=1 Tax=Dryococelus australis TaxID=614101 RepID=A0ABQ9HG04_9NEOP|nr:hypothetical protein PR048_015089 [Dryococelus australis]